jgi:dGTP triphosphohydrolase
MTNHSGLRYLFDQPKLNSRKFRWMALFSEFNFEIKHINGKENKVVDALSRSMKVIHLEAMSTCELDLKDRVIREQKVYEFFKTMKAYIEQDPTRMKYEGYQLLNDVLLTYKGRLYIPNCDDLKRFIMDELHKTPYIGDLGYHKIITTTTKIFVGQE